MGTICTCKKSGKRHPPSRAVASKLSDLQVGASLPTENTLKEFRSVRKRTTEKSRHYVLDQKLPKEELLEGVSGIPIEKQPNISDKKLLLSSLDQHFVLRYLEHSSKQYLISLMKSYSFKAKSIIFEQGSLGNAFFIIDKGSVEVIVNDQRRALLKQGQCFGELALLENSPRSATIRALEKTSVWVLDRQSFKEAVKEINELSYAENLQFVQSVQLLQVLNDTQKAHLVTSLRIQYYPKDSIIFSEGDEGNFFYIIKEGTVVCSENKVKIREMSRGDYFGELALLYNSSRTATITCVNDVKVASIDRQQLIEVLGNSLEQVIYHNTMRIILEHSSLLQSLPADQIDKVITNVDILTYQDLEEVEVPAEHILLVLKGHLRSSSSNFDSFKCIENIGTTTSEKFFANGELHLGVLPLPRLEECLGWSIKELLNMNELYVAFRKIHLIRHLPNDKIRQMLQQVQVQEYSDEEVIVQENTLGDSFYIVKEGTVQVIKSHIAIRTIPKFDYFGERSMLLDEFRSASVVARGMASCWVLSRADFHQVVDEDILKQLRKRMELQDDTVQLNDLVPVKPLGSGMFGYVYLTVHQSKGTMYSLKTVLRSKAEEYCIYENLLLEREILLEVDHPMIMKLVKTFKDEDRLYFLLEYVRGMDLFDVLRVLNLLSEKDARFYIASLILIVEHLHSLDIVYRDLKPENLMVDDDGYLKLIDFGTAKVLSGRTYTTIGTPHYMAPEVILGCGYGLAADWWSVGILLYEFLFGILPFGDDEEDPQVVYEQVVEQRLLFPSFCDPMSSVRNLIQQLLSRNPNSRLLGNSNKLKEHRWFRNFNWNDLLCRKINPPFIPNLEDLEIEVADAIANQNVLEEMIRENESEFQQSEFRHRTERSPEGWDDEF